MYITTAATRANNNADDTDDADGADDAYGSDDAAGADGADIYGYDGYDYSRRIRKYNDDGPSE